VVIDHAFAEIFHGLTLAFFFTELPHFYFRQPAFGRLLREFLIGHVRRCAGRMLRGRRRSGLVAISLLPRMGRCASQQRKGANRDHTSYLCHAHHIFAPYRRV
jgi:hypothetical protein